METVEIKIFDVSKCMEDIKITKCIYFEQKKNRLISDSIFYKLFADNIFYLDFV